MPCQLTQPHDSNDREKLQHVTLSLQLGQHEVQIEGEGGDYVYNIHRRPHKVQFARGHHEADDDFESKPSVTGALDVEKGFVWLGLFLCQPPVYRAVEHRLRGVHQDRHSHLGVSLEAERQDGNGDEKHRDHGDDLKQDRHRRQSRHIPTPVGKGTYLHVDYPDDTRRLPVDTRSNETRMAQFDTNPSTRKTRQVQVNTGHLHKCMAGTGLHGHAFTRNRTETNLQSPYVLITHERREITETIHTKHDTHKFTNDVHKKQKRHKSTKPIHTHKTEKTRIYIDHPYKTRYTHIYKRRPHETLHAKAYTNHLQKNETAQAHTSPYLSAIHTVHMKAIHTQARIYLHSYSGTDR